MNVTIHNYKTGELIGQKELTQEQWDHYISLSQQPEGVIALGDLPHDLYDLNEDHQGLSDSTTIYMDR